MQGIQILNLNFKNCAGNIDQSEIIDWSGSSASCKFETHSVATDRRSFAIPDWTLVEPVTPVDRLTDSPPAPTFFSLLLFFAGRLIVRSFHVDVPFRFGIDGFAAATV